MVSTLHVNILGSYSSHSSSGSSGSFSSSGWFLLWLPWSGFGASMVWVWGFHGLGVWLPWSGVMFQGPVLCFKVWCSEGGGFWCSGVLSLFALVLQSWFFSLGSSVLVLQSWFFSLGSSVFSVLLPPLSCFSGVFGVLVFSLRLVS
ncbi:hypothetical protein G6F56_011015 [Rhizopus delemar]|nr:hypothetical protein G6F56_011015 [Rhizopus delemar]